jgi:hypothetical protein
MVQTLSMRMKLLLAMLALVASVALMGMTANAANAQVTEITNVYNYTNKEIYIWNHESGKRIEIAPAGVYQGKPKPTVSDFNEWVPWASDSDRFDEGHFIEVGNVETLYECGGIRYCPRFSFWQERRKDGDYIRYTGKKPPDGPLKYRAYADPMPGDSDTGDTNHLCIRNLGPRIEPIDVELVVPWSRC